MLPRLRRNLDMMPSPWREQPGLLIRDPMGYSESVIVVPWVWARTLDCFDGRHSELDLLEALRRVSGAVDVRSVQDQLIGALSKNAFLEDEVFAAVKHRKQREFAESPVRTPSHAGSAYPADRKALEETMRGYFDPAEWRQDGTATAIAAPHVSPFGGWQSYRAAYAEMPRDASDCTFIILGTSHYGEPDRFGLTRKPYQTPLGSTRTDEGIVRRLRSAVREEDYCHAVEHSIEFQVLFLQWLYGADIRIVPILCGPFAQSIYAGGKPEANDGVKRFLGELREIAEAQNGRARWVLGIDMAHIGKRYGDELPAIAHQGYLTEVAARDAARNERVTAGDADGFWDLIQQNRDDLRWCGSSPLYTFLQTMPHLRGQVRRYEQWNIDEASVVSFAGISFTS